MKKQILFTFVLLLASQNTSSMLNQPWYADTLKRIPKNYRFIEINFSEKDYNNGPQREDEKHSNELEKLRKSLTKNECKSISPLGDKVSQIQQQLANTSTTNEEAKKLYDSGQLFEHLQNKEYFSFVIIYHENAPSGKSVKPVKR